ncbi:MAG: tRNA pseudouridine(55) synthase TruB [Chloroflexi bacterium]|nr:tRNA pseudouridine(55) synthase TruB [Chloroflexota bacterium]
MDGFLNLWKPPGITSFQVVRRVRHVTGQRRAGHGGTLDPGAEGVLPVALGQATRALEYLHLQGKVYRAGIFLGASTDTYDASGRVTGVHPLAASREVVEAALGRFRGEVWQRPPPYSALKQGGEPLYRRVRRGEVVSPRARRVHFYRLEMAEWQPPLVTLDVECGAGTYIRSLAHDLGEVLGCGAHLGWLKRLRVGPFAATDSVSLAALEAGFAVDGWRWLYPLDAVMLPWQAAILGPGREDTLAHGGAIASTTSPPSTLCRAYSLEGEMLGVLRSREGQWCPDKVFSLPTRGQ